MKTCWALPTPSDGSSARAGRGRCTWLCTSPLAILHQNHTHHFRWARMNDIANKGD